MSIMSRQDRYDFLTSIKRNKGTDRIKPAFANYVLSVEEEQFIQDFAAEKLREVLSDPEVMAVFKRLKDC